MTKITSDDVWATDITTVEPPLPKKQNGFECGDADPDHFNWLFKTYSQALLTLSDAYDAFVSATDNQLVILGNAITGINGQIVTLLTRTSRSASQIQTGMVELADKFEAEAGNATGVVMTPASTKQAMDYNGILLNFFASQTLDRWEIVSPLPVSGNNSVAVDYTNTQDAKGFYMVSIRRPPINASAAYTFDVPFNIYWIDGLVTRGDPVRVHFEVPTLESDIFVQVFVADIAGQTSFGVSLRNTSDKSLVDPAEYLIQTVHRMILPAKATA